MKKIFTTILLMSSLVAMAQTSPDGRLSVNVKCDNGTPVYSVSLDGTECVTASALGLVTNMGDYTKGMTMTKTSEEKLVKRDYTSYKLKRAVNHYEANSKSYTLAKDGRDVMKVVFEVSNTSVAFRYQLLPWKRDVMCCVINSEATEFAFGDATTTFLAPQMGEMSGFARTTPSYETHYEADAAMGKNGQGSGYTFPCLFKSPVVKGKKQQNVWMLVSETGTKGNYVGCKIEAAGARRYKVSFPSMKENNGYGTNTVQAPLPFDTPWRTITVSDNLKDIVESMVTWDVIEDKSLTNGSMNVLADGKDGLKGDDMKSGEKALDKEALGTRGAWSWIIANDESCNYETQMQYIDFAAAMGWETLLIDAQWDRQIGRERMVQLANYAKAKGVGLYLWYNSNGVWNDAPQTPRNCMDRAYERRKEMEWLKANGIKGIKVDFFGGDKMCTMQLYHDILMDAKDYDIKVIFHGCTLPRGWEVMYPNYVASEAVRASENLHFEQRECDREAMDATFLPFIRNAVGSMDFGGSTLNWYYNPKNSKEMWGGHRITSDVFAIATAVLFQSSVQHFAMAPGNLTDAPQWAVDFMKNVPATWQDVRFIDGYPGKFVVLARKSMEGKWFVTGINAEKEPLVMKIPTDMFEAGKDLIVYCDDNNLQGTKKLVKIGKKKEMTVTIPCNGGVVVTQ